MHKPTEAVAITRRARPPNTRNRYVKNLRSIPIPPSEEDFTADPAELSFVFAFSRLVFEVIHDPTFRSPSPASSSSWPAASPVAPGKSCFRIAAIAWLLLGTIDAGYSEWLVRPGHFAERHGLIVIITIGEVIVALGPNGPSSGNTRTYQSQGNQPNEQSDRLDLRH